MKKFTTLKTLLVGLLALGATSAWADEWSIDFSAIGQNYDDKTGVTISTKVATIGGTDMGTCKVGNEDLNSNFVLQVGTSWLMRKSSGLYQGNSGGRAMGMLNCTKNQIITIVGTGDPNPSTNATLKNQSGNTYVYTVTEDGNVKFTPARYLYFTSISVTNPSASEKDYTVKYFCGDVEIKTASTYSGEVGANAAISEQDKKAIYYNNKKYLYDSDNSEGKTIAEDGSTVVTVNFVEANKYTYKIKAVDESENTLKEFEAREQFEGDNATYYYPMAINVDGTWYKCTENDAEPLFGVSFSEAGEKSITYATTTDFDLFVEGDDLNKSKTDAFAAGTTKQSVHSSGNGSRLSPKSYVYTDALEAGTYTISIRVRNQRAAASEEDFEGLYLRDLDGQYTKIDKMFGAWTNQTYSVKTIENVAIPQNSSFAIHGSEEYNSNLEIDYLTFKKTSDEAPAIPNRTATIGQNGYTTFASAYNVSLPTGVKAYTAKVNEAGTYVNFTEITSGTIPANTGVLLEGNPGDITLTVVESASSLTDNDFIAGTGAAPSDNTKTYFAMVKDSDPLAFGKIAAGVVVPANKAYLAVAAGAFVPESARLTVTFDGEATGIKTVENAKAGKAIYNLNGQRVNKAQKGLYIVNGKKTIVK